MIRPYFRPGASSKAPAAQDQKELGKQCYQNLPYDHQLEDPQCSCTDCLKQVQGNNNNNNNNKKNRSKGMERQLACQ